MVRWGPPPQVGALGQGHRQGGAKGAAAPPNKKKEKRERGEEERKKEEKEKRNKMRKEVKPVIPRTCFHGPLVAPRPPTATRPLTIIASAFRGRVSPPFRKILPTSLGPYSSKKLHP